MLDNLKRQGILFCLVGPSGSGKTYFSKEIISREPRTKLSISMTSRLPRSGEVTGVDYHFVERSEFEAKIKRGELFEWEEVHGNLYGTLKSIVQDAIDNGADLLLDIDIRGALNFKKHFAPNTCLIFMVPPSFSVLMERLNARGAMTADDKAKRIKTAQEEYGTVLDLAKDPEAIDYLVVNDDLQETLSRLLAIIYAERMRLVRLDIEQVKNLCCVG